MGNIINDKKLSGNNMIFGFIFVTVFLCMSIVFSTTGNAMTTYGAFNSMSIVTLITSLVVMRYIIKDNT